MNSNSRKAIRIIVAFIWGIVAIMYITKGAYLLATLFGIICIVFLVKSLKRERK